MGLSQYVSEKQRISDKFSTNGAIDGDKFKDLWMNPDNLTQESLDFAKEIISKSYLCSVVILDEDYKRPGDLPEDQDWYQKTKNLLWEGNFYEKVRLLGKNSENKDIARSYLIDKSVFDSNRNNSVKKVNKAYSIDEDAQLSKLQEEGINEIVFKTFKDDNNEDFTLLIYSDGTKESRDLLKSLDMPLPEVITQDSLTNEKLQLKLLRYDAAPHIRITPEDIANKGTEILKIMESLKIADTRPSRYSLNEVREEVAENKNNKKIRFDQFEDLLTNPSSLDQKTIDSAKEILNKSVVCLRADTSTDEEEEDSPYDYADTSLRDGTFYQKVKCMSAAKDTFGRSLVDFPGFHLEDAYLIDKSTLSERQKKSVKSLDDLPKTIDLLKMQEAGIREVRFKTFKGLDRYDRPIDATLVVVSSDDDKSKALLKKFNLDVTPPKAITQDTFNNDKLQLELIKNRTFDQVRVVPEDTRTPENIEKKEKLIQLTLDNFKKENKIKEMQDSSVTPQVAKKKVVQTTYSANKKKNNPITM